ncbi:MAG TPA: PPC domain-containing protein [Candidatus Acidoferrales bacterium]|nr:PPC domain-containing protein [Candidatus Acidoferrales bacterium]
MRTAGVLLVATAALAQQPQPDPHAGYVYPAGGRQGSTFEVTTGGQALNGVNNVYLSGPGVRVRIVEYERPMTPAQANTLREQAQELNKKRLANPAAFPAEDMQKLLEIRDKLAKFVRRPMNPAIAETVRIEVSVDASAAPGERELRLATPNGMTNPLVFQIGTLPEWTRKAAEAMDAPGVARPAQQRNITPSTAAAAPVDVTLPVVINGQIMPGAIDRYRFRATKGQRLVAAANARELIPYISDAVPGWFQAALALRDASGKEVGYADHYSFHPDPVLYYEIPADGQYTLEIHDSIYRGREDFVYRIQLGELPFVTSIFPLGGKAGARTAVELRGWNLPSTRLVESGKAKGLELISLSNSNRVPFAVDTLPEAAEKEPNDRPQNAQKLKLPVIVNGRIDRPGDQDVFRFDGKAGDEIVAEVTARRLDSPLDSILRLTDAKGKELAVNDDTEDKSAALLTHHADSRILLKLPAKGTYYLYLGDTQHKGGPDYAYRLRVGRPQPDFELRVTPSGINARSGATVPVAVYAIRRDGFDGEIAVKLKDAPPGFALDGAVIPSGTDHVRMTLTVPVVHIESPHKFALEGHASIAGREVHHTAIAAEDMMQAFYYHHLVPATELVVRVMGPQRPPVLWKAFGDKPVRVPAGGTAPVQVPVPNPRLNGQVLVTLSEPPEGISIQSVTPARDGVSVVLKADPAKVKPGLKGNLILEAFVERPAPNNAKQPIRRQPLGTLPAMPFEIVK